MYKQYPCLNCIKTTVIVIVIVTTGASYLGELLKVNNSLQELDMGLLEMMECHQIQ